jgi:hypothetical protein
MKFSHPKIGDLVRDNQHQDGAEIGLVVSQPWAEPDPLGGEADTYLCVSVQFVSSFIYSVDVEDLELISETR